MFVKIVDAPGVPGGRALALCDENGQPLGGQISAVVETGVGERPRITVTFGIDGKSIRFAD